MAENPFTVDTYVRAVAQSLGLLEVSSQEHIDIDKHVLPVEYFHWVPDYDAIRKAWADGVEVRGAKRTGAITYILREVK